ncbi:unnamed protein product [Rotaria socialis]
MTIIILQLLYLTCISKINNKMIVFSFLFIKNDDDKKAIIYLWLQAHPVTSTKVHRDLCNKRKNEAYLPLSIDIVVLNKCYPIAAPK